MAGKRKRSGDKSDAGAAAAVRSSGRTAAEVEAGMLQALREGDALLGWAKAPQDPWWPCIAARSAMPLELFDEIDPTDLELPLGPDGAAPKGKMCCYFLGEETCCLVDNGHFDAGAWAHKPVPKHMEERKEYAAGVRLAERLQAQMDALEEAENGGGAGAGRRARPTRSASVSTTGSTADAAAANARTNAGASAAPAPARPSRVRSSTMDAAVAAAVPPSPAASVASNASNKSHANGNGNASRASGRRPAPTDTKASTTNSSSSAAKRQRPVVKSEPAEEQQPQQQPQPRPAATPSAAAAGQSTRPLTPEEVEKIRRLAEGLLYMGEVAAFQQQQAEKGLAGSSLREDLNALRLFVSRGYPALGQATLQRLEGGLRAYVGRMKAQLAGGQRELDRFRVEVQADPTSALAACEGAYGELGKELKRTLAKLEAHRAALEAEVLAKVKRSQARGGALARAVAAEAQGVLAGVRSSIASLVQLQEAVGGGGGGGAGVAAANGSLANGDGGGGSDVASVASGPSLGMSISHSAGGGGGKKGGSGRLDARELLYKAEAAFKLGEEVTGDQVAAVEHLRKACEDFRQRLVRKMQQQKQAGTAGTAGAAAAAAFGAALPSIPEHPASPADRTDRDAKRAAERRQSEDAQRRFFSHWSPTY